MSDITTTRFATSPGLLRRLMASIDRFLMTSACIAVRNGDVAHFVL